jgi:SNF2 family DNA or RNA helicase
VPATEAVRNLFPSAPKLPDGNRVVVKHDLRNTLLLSCVGLHAPNPMLEYYDWCGGKPFRVQKETCKMLVENPRSYVLNHMGTGKTKTTLWAWEYLYTHGLCGKLLVVAPLSTLNFVWAREVFSTLPHRKVSVLHGSRQKRIDRLAADVDIYVINHDGLATVAEELAARKDITVLVLDELAVYRNNSNRSKLMRKFSTRFDIVWGLTGAPMPNKPTDVWSQCMIVTPNTVPKYFKQAQEMLMYRVSQWVWKPKPDAVDNAFRMMQPAVRFALDDVVELPDVVERTIDVDLSPTQTKVYTEVFKFLCSQVASEKINAVNAGVAMGKLLQISSGWVYSQAPVYISLDAGPRINTLLDLIDSAERKLLVFVPFRHALEGLSKHLDDRKIEHCVVHGDIADRDKLFNLFQNTDKYKVLLAHPECLAHGLTLTAADTIIWYSPIPSLEIYEQANARIRRVGQKHRQQVIHLQGTPVEKKIYALLRSKQKVQDQLLSMFEDATTGQRTP